MSLDQDDPDLDSSDQSGSAAPPADDGVGTTAVDSAPWWSDERRAKRASIAVVAVALVPFLVGAWQTWFRLRGNYVPTADRALLELNARDAFDHIQTLGAYSHWGWNHPGPALIDVLGAGYRLFGSNSVSLLLTTLVVNAVAVMLIAWVAYRRGRFPGVVAVLVPTMLLAHALGADRLRDPWNPYVPILSLLLLATCCWSIAIGDVGLLALAVGAASFAIQSHIGVTLLTIAMLGFALVYAVVRVVRHREETRRLVRAVIWAVVVGVVMWLPVLYGTVVKHDGNVNAVLQFFRDPPGKRYGFDSAVRVMALQWNARPHWMFGEAGLGGTQPLEQHPWAAVTALLGIAAFVFALRRRNRSLVTLSALVAVAFAASMIAVSQIVGAVASYLAQWAWVAGALLGLLIVEAVFEAVRAYGGARSFGVVLFVATAVVAGTALFTARDATRSAHYPLARYATNPSPERAMAEKIAAALPPGNGDVYLRIGKAGEPAAGVALELINRGISVKISDRDCINVVNHTRCNRMFGDRYSAKPGHYRAAVQLLGRRSTDKFLYPSGKLIGSLRVRQGLSPAFLMYAYMVPDYTLVS